MGKKPFLEPPAVFAPFARKEARTGEFKVLPDVHLVALAEAGREPASSRAPSTRPPHLRDLGAAGESRIALPLDLIVPVPVRMSSDAMDLRSAFLLLHADGRSTIAQIAEAADLPRLEVYERFLELRDIGAVQLRTLAELRARPLRAQA